MRVPTVSVIIPTRNEEANIEETLRSVSAQDFPDQSLEILVVDGISTDRTRELVRRFIDGHPARSIRMLDNPHRTTPHALNIGLEESHGEVVVLVGGHCALSNDYLLGAVRALDEKGASIAGGVLRSHGKGRAGRGISVAMSSAFGVGPARFRYGQQGGWVDTVAFGAYRRELFEQIGGFDEELVRNQDDEFNYRATQAGAKIWFEPAIHATYEVRNSFHALWKQYFQYGLFKVRVIQKRSGVPSWRHLVPAVFVVTLATTALRGALSGKWAPFLLSGCTYGGVNLGASLWANLGQPSLAPATSAAFGVMHLAYGFGFVKGLWAWRRGYGSLFHQQRSTLR